MTTEVKKESPDFGEKLLRKVRITKSARYYASTFYNIKAQYSNASIGFLSAYIIIVNLLPMLKTNLISTDFISFFTISVSILVLVFGQIESSKEYKLCYSRLLNCGKELRSLENEIDRVLLLNKGLDDAERAKRLETLSDQYDTILKKYQENHNFASFHKARISVDKEKFGFWHKHFIEMRYILLPRIQYLTLIGVPPLIMVYWFFHQ